MAPSALHGLSSEASVSPFMRVGFIVSALSVIYISYFLAYAVHNVYFHPLSKLPGPKSWIAFPFLQEVSKWSGLHERHMRALHLRYGFVVRHGPNEVSFISAQAWKDIYGHGHQQFPKKVFKDPGMAHDIINANNADHTRFRRAIAYAFSEKALRDQEPLMTTYVDLLIEKLNEMAISGEKVDMVKWYNLTTFDLMGDLAFGESFNGLRNKDMHAWVATIYKSIKAIPFLQTITEYPMTAALLNYCMPSYLKKARETHYRYSHDTTMKRINNKPLHGRGDFMDSMLKKREEKEGLTDEEIVANSQLLIIAGSETTATLLSGVTFWALDNPRVWKKVVDEVRSAFKEESEITFANATARLPYMLACLDEALRYDGPC